MPHEEIDAADLRKPDSEAAFQRQVIDLARLHGWRVASFRRVRVQRRNGSVYYETPVGAGGKGWPDLFMLRGGDALALELKYGRNKVTAEQIEWIAAMNAAGIECRVVRPADWEWITRRLGD